MTASFKMTFNKPAFSNFMAGEDADGLKVNISNGSVQFLPVSKSNDPDVIPLNYRPKRGGGESIVEGSKAAELFAALKKMGSVSPFFTLTRLKGGWIGLEPYNAEAAPTRFTPHLRLWVPSEVPASVAPARTVITQPKNAPSVFSMTLGDILFLQKQVSEYEADRRPGRPPGYILSAKHHLDDFHKAVAPIMRENVEHTLIEAAYNALALALGKPELNAEAPEAPAPQPEVAAPVIQARKAKAKAKEAAPKEAPVAKAPVIQPAADASEVSDAEVAALAEKFGLTGERPQKTNEPNVKAAMPRSGLATQRLGSRSHSVIVERRGGLTNRRRSGLVSSHTHGHHAS